MGDFPGNFLLRVRLTTDAWVSGWKAVLGLVSRRGHRGGAQCSSRAQLPAEVHQLARTQARSQRHHERPAVRQDRGRTGFVSFSSLSTRDREAHEVWMYKLNSGWWHGFMKENPIVTTIPLNPKVREETGHCQSLECNRRDQENREVAKETEELSLVPAKEDTVF